MDDSQYPLVIHNDTPANVRVGICDSSTCESVPAGTTKVKVGGIFSREGLTVGITQYVRVESGDGQAECLVLSDDRSAVSETQAFDYHLSELPRCHTTSWTIP